MKRMIFLILCISTGVLCATPSSEKKTVCLNMIVKNERDVIAKCLHSVRGIIDYWVICDTGSTDGTQQVIQECLQGVPGELHERPWVDFAHNRNEALLAARNKADYILFIDADEVLTFSEKYALPELTHDAYNMRVRQLGAGDCLRVSLVKASLNWKWKGKLHEVITASEAKTYAILEGILNICNASKGARSKDPEKFLKDAHILEKALQEEPANSRYVYYIGQSYLAADKYESALKYFEKRVSMPSEDVQETYLSLYNIGVAQEKLGKNTLALESFTRAYQYRPTRAEPLLRMAVLHRKQGNYLLGFLLSQYALTHPCPSEDVCVEYITYDYARLIEFANCALLLGKFHDGLRACTQLLQNPNLPEDVQHHVRANYELAQRKVKMIENLSKNATL